MDWLKRIPKRLARVTSSGKFIAEIDGFRFLAIFPVVIQHLSERLIRYSTVDWAVPVDESPVAFAAGRGTVGVFIFFALSGFILSLPFARSFLSGRGPLPLGPYFWRRVTRLEPPYLLWMVLFFVVLLLKGDHSFTDLLPHLGASVFYMHNIIFEGYSPINPVAWSLEIEIQFYLVAPFVAALIFSISRPWLRRLVLGALLLGYITLQHYLGWTALPFRITLLGQFQHFLVGFFLTDIYLTQWKKNRPARNLVWDIVAVAAMVTLGLSWSEDYYKNLLFSLALLLLLIAGFRGRWLNRLLNLPWLTAIGGMCYTIYLIHLPLLEGLVRLTSRFSVGDWFGANLLFQGVLTLPVILLFSMVFFLAVEQPCMDRNWPASFLRKLKNWREKTFLQLKKVLS